MAVPKSRVFVLCFTTFVCGLSGCSGSNWEEPNPVNSRYLYAPKVWGPWASDENGAVVGTWENLRPLGISVDPNPFNPMTTITFSLPEADIVWMWIVRVVMPGDSDDDAQSAAGASFVVPGGAPVSVLLDGVLMQAGAHDIEWTARDQSGRMLPEGVYRVCLAAGERFFSYRDMLLKRSY